MELAMAEIAVIKITAAIPTTAGMGNHFIFIREVPRRCTGKRQTCRLNVQLRCHYSARPFETKDF